MIGDWDPGAQVFAVIGAAAVGIAACVAFIYVYGPIDANIDTYVECQKACGQLGVAEFQPPMQPTKSAICVCNKQSAEAH